MRVRKFWTPFLCLSAILLSSGFIQAETHYTYAPAPNKAIYFGHISYTEVENDAFDPLVFSEHNLPPKKAVLNFPLGPGDSVRTSSERRCEIQFDTGTILRLDYDSEVQIETILAPSLTSRSKISNIVLKRGQAYIMYKRYNRPEVFQVFTPNASVKLDHNSVSSIKVEDGLSQVWVDQGKVHILYGPDSKHTRTHKLKKSRTASVTPDHQLLMLTGDLDQEFSLWNKDMNANFLELHKGETSLPKPIQRLPKAVFYFAQKYSNIHGEWLWDSFYGYVWRPFYNDSGPWGTWTPYYYGQWHMTNDQLFWVPMESWGWVPYHLGVWVWNKNKGWLWLPGSAFAPSWATWRFFFGPNMLAWRSLGPWDWVTGIPGFYRDQKSPKLYPPYQIPKELKEVVKKVEEGIARNDPKVMEDISGSVREYAMVRAKDLNTPRIHKRLANPGTTKATINSGIYRESPNPSQTAVNLYWMYGTRSQIIQDVLPVQEKLNRSIPRNGNPSLPEFSHYGKAGPATDRMEPKTAIHRFRDWNPDAKVANRQGVVLRYVSRQNVISAPEMSYNRSLQRRNSFMQGRSLGGSYASSGSRSNSGTSSSASSGSSSQATGSTSSSSGAGRGSGGRGKK